jgi:Rrf2 family protein
VQVSTNKGSISMLSKTAEYALRVAVWLAQSPEEPVSADRLAKVTKIPRRYLHKVVQDLVRGGLVRSQPGPGGGYAINRQPQQVTILDVVNAVEPMERIRHCPLGLPSHTRLCPLHRELDKVYAASEQALARVTLSQLLRSTSSIVPLCDVKSLTRKQPQ